MTWSDQNCPTKGVYSAMIFLLKKCVKLCNIFIDSYFIYFGYNTASITDYEELLFSLDQTDTQLSHCGQLNTVEYALSNYQTV